MFQWLFSVKHIKPRPEGCLLFKKLEERKASKIKLSLFRRVYLLNTLSKKYKFSSPRPIIRRDPSYAFTFLKCLPRDFDETGNNTQNMFRTIPLLLLFQMTKLISANTKPPRKRIQKSISLVKKRYRFLPRKLWTFLWTRNRKLERKCFGLQNGFD